MDTFFEIIFPVIIILLCLFLIIFVAGFCIYKYTVEIAEANIIVVFQGDEQLYAGKQAFVSINSGGMTTTITIYKKLFPFPIVERTYSDKDIRVVGYAN